MSNQEEVKESYIIPETEEDKDRIRDMYMMFGGLLGHIQLYSTRPDGVRYMQHMASTTASRILASVESRIPYASPEYTLKLNAAASLIRLFIREAESMKMPE